MKTIKTLDGKIQFTAYELKDLPEPSKEKAINDHIQFEIDIMDEDSSYFYLAEEMEKMKTPWFLAETIYERELHSIIETIEINEYYFDVMGEMIPITKYVDKHPKAGSFSWRFHGEELPVTIE